MDMLRGGWGPGMLGNGMGVATGGGSSYDAATEAIAAAFTTPPTTARKNLIDAAVVALKSAGVWSKLDALYAFAAADSQAAKINWKQPGTYNATEVNAPAFTADQGFLGAATKSIDSGFNPSTAPTPNFVQNSAMIAGWALTDFNEPGAGHSMVLATTGTWNLLQQRAGNAYWVGVNSSNYATGASADGSGLWALSRTSSGSISLYRNGSLVNAHSITSEAVPTTTWRFVNDWPGIMAGGAIGSQLSAGDNTALYNALRTYLTGVGVP